MKTITMDALYGDAQLNQFMHAADVFEPFKQLAELHEITLDVSFEDDEIERANNTVMHVTNALEKTGNNVVFIAIKKIDSVPVRMANYIKPNVSVISSGKSFYMFHELLTRIGYDVETNQQMQVISVK